MCVQQGFIKGVRVRGVNCFLEVVITTRTIEWFMADVGLRVLGLTIVGIRGRIMSEGWRRLGWWGISVLIMSVMRIMWIVWVMWVIIPLAQVIHTLLFVLINGYVIIIVVNWTNSIVTVDLLNVRQFIHPTIVIVHQYYQPPLLTNSTPILKLLLINSVDCSSPICLKHPHY